VDGAPVPVRLTPASDLNLRTGPGVEHARIVIMKADTELIVVEDPQGALDTLGESGWIKVRTPDGKEGWTAARYLKRL
jgi:uncharacterized protein YraI